MHPITVKINKAKTSRNNRQIHNDKWRLQDPSLNIDTVNIQKSVKIQNILIIPSTNLS